MPLTTNIVGEDTTANLLAGEPYAADYHRQLFVATDTDGLHRVKADGTLTSNLAAETAQVVLLSQTGSTLAVPGLLATAEIELIARDNTIFYPDAYTVTDNTITLVTAAANESFLIRYKQ